MQLEEGQGFIPKHPPGRIQWNKTWEYTKISYLQEGRQLDNNNMHVGGAQGDLIPLARMRVFQCVNCDRDCQILAQIGEYLPQIGADWHQVGKIWDFLSSVFSTCWLTGGEPTCPEN